MSPLFDRLKTIGTSAAKTAVGVVAPTATGLISLAERLRELPKKEVQPAQTFRVGVGLTPKQTIKAREVISKQAELQKQEAGMVPLKTKLISLVLPDQPTTAVKAKALTSFGTKDPELLAIQKEELMNVGLMSAGIENIGGKILKKALPSLGKKVISGKIPPESTQRLEAELPPLSKQEVPTYKPTETRFGKDVKERKFLQSVKEDPRISQETKNLLEQLPDERKYYDVFTDAEAVTRAQIRILESTDESLSYVLSAKNLDKDVSTTGIELMRTYRKAGNVKMEAEVATNLAEKATQSGQFIQALSILDKLSPEGILIQASKRIGKPLSPELTEKLVTQAAKIKELPFGFEKIKQTQDLAETISRAIPMSFGVKATGWLTELANLPRTLASSFFDFSFGLRQGLVPLARHPKEWTSAFKSQFKPFFSEKGYEQLMDTVVKHPDFTLASQSGVAFADLSAQMSAREERFMSSLAEKIPVIGKVVRATNRAYTSMANKLRMDLFSRFIKDTERIGVEVRKDQGMLRSFAEAVNDFTGRGDLPDALKKAAPILNAFFYSPRLMASRLHLLNPVRYLNQPAPVRNEVLKTMLSFGATMTTILGLASLNKNVKVGSDPRSADFAKIKVGDTRFDIAGGFQQYLRIAAQLLTGKYVSSSTGKVITLGEGYKPLTRLEILAKGVESKEAPVFSFITTLLKGQDSEGNKLNIPKEAGQKFIPMVLSDIYDIAKSDPDLLPAGFLGMLGIGTQTYAPPEAYRKLNEISNSSDPAGEFEKLKKASPILAEKVKRAKIESAFNEFDWGLVSMGVENGNRARFLMEHFNKLPNQEAKATLWEELRKKKIISERVAEQINYLMENPDYQPQ